MAELEPFRAYPFSVMVKETICKEGLIKISSKRCQSCGKSGLALYASAREPSTFLSVEPVSYTHLDVYKRQIAALAGFIA